MTQINFLKKYPNNEKPVARGPRQTLIFTKKAVTVDASTNIVGFLNSPITNAHGFLAVGYAFVGGFIASLPSVCLQPCLLNVNSPESRGAALTAANLIIQLAHGAEPSSITLMSTVLHVDRQFSFNFTVSD
jgi:hypothetical protein